LFARSHQCPLPWHTRIVIAILAYFIWLRYILLIFFHLC
jgi:hypothetical protein